MDEIVVTKSKLIAIMKDNREKHHEIVLEAQAGFRAKVIERLDEMLKIAAAGKKIDINVGLQLPQDYTHEYDTVIGMLELDINPEVKLDYTQYKNWVMDEWQWSRQFTTSNASYSATAARSM
jgi:hypothetical protein